IIGILTSLGMRILSSDSQGCKILVPTAKVDVTREVDVIEEILRIHGYDEVPVPSKLSISLPQAVTPSEKLRDRVADHLASNGFNELLTNSLTSIGKGPIEDNGVVGLLNPLSQDLSVMRTDMIQTILEAIQYNRNRKQDNMRFFEFGKCYHKSTAGYSETDRLAIVVAGNVFDPHWKFAASPVDFFQLKAHVQSVLALCGIDEWEVTTLSDSDEYMAIGQLFSVGKQPLIRLGSLKRSTARHYDLNGPVYYADFFWGRLVKLASRKQIKVNEIPRFPQVRRDLSMLIDRSLEFGKIETLAYSTERKILTEVVLFDVYEGDKLEQGKKSYAVSFVLQDQQQTLTDQVIEKTMDRLMKAFEKELGAVIRTGN
ncbi:MAG: phenylalanine--tRNA ligase subunit beta, partial [Bacteroidota bacterium]